MRIALIIRHFSLRKGGVERYAVELAVGLVGKGHEVHVFCETSDAPILSNIVIRRIPVFFGPNFLKFLTFHFRCQRQLEEEAFDVVHALTQTYPADIYRMCDGMYLQRIFRRYPSRIRRILGYLFRPIYLMNVTWEKKIIGGGGCRLLIANSSFCAAPVQAFYPLAMDRVCVIYNGVNLDRFHPGVKSFRPDVRKAYNIDNSAPLVLFPSMDFSRKGLAALIQSLVHVRKIFPGIRLVVIGKGNPRPYLKLAALHGIEKDLLFLGKVDDPAQLYGAADLVVVPTHFDPFANVCLEAMACGLPVVTTRQNGAAELIEEGVNGYTIEDPGKIEELAEKIVLSLSNHSRIGDKAAETAISFSQAIHVQSIIDVYLKVASEKISLEITSHSPFMVINRAFLSLLKKNNLLSYGQIMTYQYGITLKQIMARTIKRLKMKNEKGEDCLFYLKRHCPSFSFSSIAKRRDDSSEGRREWNSILAFHEAGLPTMVPVAMGECRTWFSKESFLMTEALDGYEPMEKWIPSMLTRYPQKKRSQVKRELIREVALLARKMHQAGFYHRDYYLTHILLRLTSGKFDLKIIDLQRAIRYPWYKGRWKIKDLASLNYSASKEIFTGRDRLLFYKFYEGGRRLDESDLAIIKMIQKKTQRIDSHTIKMYQKRESRKRLGLLER